MICAAMRRSLRGDHEVVTLEDARTALEQIARGEQFDVILCDLMMPNMTGMEFHEELSRLAPTVAERVIFMTGGAFVPAAREFLDRVDLPRLEKPVDVPALRAILRTVLRSPPSLVEPVAAPTTARGGEPARKGSSGHSVLVVEDDVLVAAMIDRLLKDDHHVTLAEDGVEALDLIVSGKLFDVILCDLIMPRMTGAELHAALSRTHPQMVERMIFISGGALMPEGRAFLDSVPNPVLEKPFLPRNLCALVEGMMIRR